MPTRDESRNTARDHLIIDQVALLKQAKRAERMEDRVALRAAHDRMERYLLSCNEARNVGREAYLTCGECEVLRALESGLERKSRLDFLSRKGRDSDA